MTDADIIAEARERLADTYYSGAHVSIHRDTLRALIALAERAPPDEPTEEALYAMDCSGPEPGLQYARQTSLNMYRALVAHLKQQKDSSLSPQVTQSDARDQPFLDWVADRLVHVYHESPNVDFVLKLRKMATRARGWRILHGNEVYLCDDHAHFLHKVLELERACVAFKVKPL